MWPVGQAVKTPASHAGNGGSIPPGVIGKVLGIKTELYGIMLDKAIEGIKSAVGRGSKKEKQQAQTEGGMGNE